MLEGCAVPQSTTFAVLISIVLTSATILSSQGAHGSTPAGLAGRMETSPLNFSGGARYDTFEWYEFLGVRPMTAADTVVVDVAIVPFPVTSTLVALDDRDGATFAGVDFQDGWANGELPYRPGSWNDVRLTAHFSERHYFVRVNGAEAGPFPFNPPSDSVQAFRVNGGGYGGQEGGWIDSVSVARHSEPARDTLLEVTFDKGETFDLVQGSLSTPSTNGGAMGGVALAVLLAIVSIPIAFLAIGGYIIFKRTRGSS